MIARCAAALERALCAAFQDSDLGVRRLTFAGLLVGVAIDGGSRRALSVCREMLVRGYVILTGGVSGDVLTLTPPACLTDEQVDAFAITLALVLAEQRGA